MIERYDIDEKKMEEGLHELMKHKVNNVLNHGGPFTLVMASESYFSTLKVVEPLINCSEYKKKIKQFEDEINNKSKLEKISK